MQVLDPPIGGREFMKKAYVVVLMLGLVSGLALPSIINALPMMNRCPRIHAASDSLKNGQAELAAAGHDFCGHKVEAQQALDNAVRQLREAETCDKCR